MLCNFPLSGYRLANGDVSFVERGDVLHTLELPCGRCMSCRLNRARDMKLRLVHEGKLYPAGLCLFLTFTYAPEHLPPLGSLRYRDLQVFFRSLRRRGVKFRFYACGEYGENLDRPHYHVILFGVSIPDLKRRRHKSGGFWKFDSELVSSLWPHGFVDIGEFTEQSAGYVTEYVTKKITGVKAEAHYAVFDPSSGEILGYREPEFAHMSLRPGLGAGWYERHKSDFRQGVVVHRGGAVQKAPRYYDKLHKRSRPDEFEDVQQDRAVRGAKLDPHERSEARRAVKDEVLRAKQAFYKRPKALG